MHGSIEIDQIRWAVEQLKQEPYSRRIVITSWEPANAQKSLLPPCHAFWVLNVQNDQNGEPLLCLHLTQRSADIALGVPYNIAGYAFLLELIGRFTAIRPGILAHSLVDAHVYVNHVDGLQKQLTRTPRELPVLSIDDSVQSLDDLEALHAMSTRKLLKVFRLNGYNPHPAINYKVAK